MHQPNIGCADLTELDCMSALPASDLRQPSKDSEAEAASEAAATALKMEAIVSNLQQRFKKDQIYVSEVDYFFRSFYISRFLISLETF